MQPTEKQGQRATGYDTKTETLTQASYITSVVVIQRSVDTLCEVRLWLRWVRDLTVKAR